MSSATTVIPFIESTLPTCNPNLMPFHIGYSGPASVSAFMRVENYKDFIAEDNMVALDGSTTDVEMKVDAPSTINPLPSNGNADAGLKSTISASSSTEVESQAASESTIAVGESQISLLSETTQAEATQASPTLPELEDADKRFVSTFRGRTIHGLTIDLPSGYSGLVLRGERSANSNQESQEERKGGKLKDQAESKAASEKPAAKPRGRLTRSAVSKPVVITVEDEDEEMEEEIVPEPSFSDVDGQLDTMESVVEISDQPDIRKLVPQAQFSSFTLWHSDRPVDKGNDEYYRALTEWMSLSHEINRTDL